MKTKLFTLFVALYATTCLWAYDFQSGDLYYDITSSREPYTVEVTYQYQVSSDNYSNLTTAVILETVTYDGTTYSVTSIGEGAFERCNNLTSVTIPNSVTTIGNGAFRECFSLTSITIPNSVTTIGDKAFAYCSGLTSMTIPNSVTSIGSNAFRSCSRLTSMTIPNSVTSIENYAFCSCSGLTSITIPNSVTSIENYAFCSCSGLTSITIPNSVTSIGEGAFSGCSGLTSITIPNSVTSIGKGAFSYCSGLTSVVWNAENCADFSSYSYAPFYDTRSYITYFTFGDSVKRIPAWLCYSMNDLTSVTIPNSVTSIGISTFKGCSGLTSITIPNSVTSIGSSAFSSCSGLTSITIPNSVTSIGARAFERCNNLTSITIPNRVTSIGDYAFSSCSRLTSVTIPNSVTSIGDKAFAYCDGLTSIESLAEVPPTLGSYAFDNVSTTIPVYVPCGKVAAYQSANGWNTFTNIQVPLVEYSIVVGVNDSIMGTSQVDYNTYCEGSQITANHNNGYHFVQWSDGNTDNPRTLELTQDTILTAEFAPNQYQLSLATNYSEMGSVQGAGTYNYLTEIEISATANYGYHFTRWNDGNTDNPRVVKVTGDKTYTAYFDKNTYSITKQYEAEQGSITGPTSGKYLDVITLTATPKTGYHFTQWSDGITDNPRTLVLTQDTAFTAEFAQSFSGQCGDNLYWSYDETTKTISITGSGDMYDYTKSTQPWLCFQEQITEVTTSNTTTSIGTSAFEGCVRLGKVSLGYAMENIAANAFAECKRLYDIYVYASYPPFAEESSFANYNVYLYVPCENQRDYILDVVWGEFKFIECIGAESDDTGGDDVTLTPGSTDVTITWPTEDEAETYSIVITKDGEVFCTLTFNSNGQLASIAFVPGRQGNHPAQYAEASANGYRFTVTGLKEGTKYAYNLDVKDSANQTIQSYSGEFTTKSNVTTDIDNVTSTTNCQKLFRDGQIIILRDGVEYNALGQIINK